MSEGSQGRTIELHTGVDAVVAGSIRRQATRIIGVDLVESLRAVSSRATQATVVESYTHRPVGCNCQVGLELIDRRRVIIDLNGRAPGEALIVGGRQDVVPHSRTVVLPGYIERIVTRGQVVTDREGVLDPVSERSIRVDQWRILDVLDDHPRSLPGCATVS